jgi:hypothetical protein
VAMVITTRRRITHDDCLLLAGSFNRSPSRTRLERIVEPSKTVRGTCVTGCLLRLLSPIRNPVNMQTLLQCDRKLFRSDSKPTIIRLLRFARPSVTCHPALRTISGKMTCFCATTCATLCAIPSSALCVTRCTGTTESPRRIREA